MAVQKDGTVRSRVLGAEMRRRREAAGLEAAQLAHWLCWSPTKICNMERGTRGISETDAAMYLGFCRTKGQDLKEVMEFFHEHGDHWMQPHGLRLSDELRGLIVLEATATQIDWFEQSVIPGLLPDGFLQPGAVLRFGSGSAPEHVEALVRARKARQAILHRTNPPVCTFFIHEFALRLEVGSHGVMNDQLLHLVFASDLPHISIRVIPASVGAHAGLKGPFLVMEHAMHRPVVYLELATTSLFINQPETVARYREIESSIATIALDEEQSRSWLARRASECDRPRGDHRAWQTDRDDPVA